MLFQVMAVYHALAPLSLICLTAVLYLVGNCKLISVFFSSCHAFLLTLNLFTASFTTYYLVIIILSPQLPPPVILLSKLMQYVVAVIPH